MTIPLTGTNPAGLFTRLGKIAALLKDLNVFASGTLPGDFSAIETLYVTSGLTNPEPALIAPLAAALTGSQQNIGSQALAGILTTLAAGTVNQMVYEDNPLNQNNNLSASLTEVIRQMTAASQSVNACTVTIATAALGTVTGNGVVVGTVNRPDGRKQENLLAETSRLVCAADAQTGGVAAGNEQFKWSGDFPESNALAFDWPLGSGASATLSATDATKNNSAGNLLDNSDFETFTSNTPNNWTITVGTAGTQVLQGSAGNSYTGAACLQLAGDGSTLTALTLAFAGTTTAGTPAKLTPDTIYAVNLALKVDAVPAAGVLEIALIDGTGPPGAITNDDQGNANSFTVALTSATTNYVFYNGVFRTPRVNPATGYKLRLRLSTALTSGKNAFIDHLAMTAPTKLYAGGPYLAVFSGSVAFIAGSNAPDTFTVTTTNNRAGSSNNLTWQTFFDRMFNMRSLGLLLPSSGSPTISDSLL